MGWLSIKCKQSEEAVLFILDAWAAHTHVPGCQQGHETSRPQTALHQKLCDRFLGSSRSAQAKKPRIPLIVDDLLMRKAFDVMRGSVPASDAAGIVDAADLLPCCLFLEPIGPTQAC